MTHADLPRAWQRVDFNAAVGRCRDRHGCREGWAVVAGIALLLVVTLVIDIIARAYA
jgi:hypothetical protein